MPLMFLSHAHQNPRTPGGLAGAAEGGSRGRSLGPDVADLLRTEAESASGELVLALPLLQEILVHLAKAKWRSREHGGTVAHAVLDAVRRELLATGVSSSTALVLL